MSSSAVRRADRPREGRRGHHRARADAPVLLIGLLREPPGIVLPPQKVLRAHPFAKKVPKDHHFSASLFLQPCTRQCWPSSASTASHQTRSEAVRRRRGPSVLHLGGGRAARSGRCRSAARPAGSPGWHGQEGALGKQEMHHVHQWNAPIDLKASG